MSAEEVLENLSFGRQIAEDEGGELGEYFVETENWRQLFRGDVDIVYGAKGSGKSALYSLLVAKAGELFDRNIIEVPAENPQGATVFRTLQKDPPADRDEFINIWKLYFLTLIAGVFRDYGLRGESADQVQQALSKAGLIEDKLSLGGILQRVYGFIKGLRPKEVGTEITVDASGNTTYFPKIVFHEPGRGERDAGAVSADELIAAASRALSENGDLAIWLVLDRLDVAFAEDIDLEQKALRALFQTYLDLLSIKNIRLKIFIRTDIWKKITEEGFREASHITRHLTITWDRPLLLNLILKRAVHNKAVLEFYRTEPAQIFASMENQEAFFFRMFPTQVDVGSKKPDTMDWLLSRTKDGLGYAPREVIHLLNELRREQKERFNIKAGSPEGDNLFERASFKAALPAVAKVRLEQTVYAETDLATKSLIEQLRHEKSVQTSATLAKIWKVSDLDATKAAEKLVTIGIFERRGPKDDPQYWTPFLYREALDLVQGTAD